MNIDDMTTEQQAEFLRKLDPKILSKWDHHSRRQNLQSIVHVAVSVLVVVASGLLGAMLVAWGLHIVLPDHQHWLSAERLAQLQSFLFSAALAALVSQYAKGMLLDKESKGN